MSAGVGPGPQGKAAVVNTEYGQDGLRQGHEATGDSAPVTDDQAIALDSAQMPANDLGKSTNKNG